MRLPEFTAEASLSKVRSHYNLTSGAAGETGNIVQPQSYSIHRYGNLTVITVCDGGICATIQIPGGISHTQM